MTENLSRHLFWDINKEKLDADKNKTIIIERVFNRGDLSDLKLIFDYYGFQTVKQEIVKAGFLDKKTLNYASLIFNLQKQEFRCYSKILSTQTHWNY